MNLVWLAMLWACTERTPGEPWTRITQGRKYEVTLELPDPVPLGELFTVRAIVRDRDGAPIEDAVVELDARMPQHDHGMETDPVDDRAAIHPGGVYETSGFKFHMRGEWTIGVRVRGPRGADDTSFVYDLP